MLRFADASMRAVSVHHPLEFFLAASSARAAQCAFWNYVNELMPKRKSELRILVFVRSILRALHQLSSSFVGGFAGGLGSVGVLFSGFTPCRESADSGITSINWLYSLSGLGISTRMILTPYCAASFGSRGA